MTDPDLPANAGLHILGADVAKHHVFFHDSLSDKGRLREDLGFLIHPLNCALGNLDCLICGVEELALAIEAVAPKASGRSPQG